MDRPHDFELQPRPRRERSIHVLVSDLEHQAVMRAARERGVSASELGRQALRYCGLLTASEGDGS